MTAWISHPVSTMAGTVGPPGDKSCSHRAVMFAGMAEGRSTLTGLLEGEDVLSTIASMRALGADIEKSDAGVWTVEGIGGRAKTDSIDVDFGNSGTSARLLMGVFAGLGVRAKMTGDASLIKRPMNRVLIPLRDMGLKDDASPEGRLPFSIWTKAPLNAIDFELPMASAQVKSCVLLAGLMAYGKTKIIETTPSRNHTENMLRAFGADLSINRSKPDMHEISINGVQKLAGLSGAIPGDPSSAAFLLSAAIISPKGAVLTDNVLCNSTRNGFFDVLAHMKVDLGAEDIDGEAFGERRFMLEARSASMVGVDIGRNHVTAMIDEFPIFAVLAAFAKGETRVTGAQELRHKESDRIDAIVAMLRANGVMCEALSDGFVIQGCDGPPPGGGLVETRHDHRIAMSALVMGTASQKPIRIDDGSAIATSYPNFFDHMAQLGADIRAL